MPSIDGVRALTLNADRAAARAAGPSADEKAAAGGATSGSASRSQDSLQRAHTRFQYVPVVCTGRLSSSLPWPRRDVLLRWCDLMRCSVDMTPRHRTAPRPQPPESQLTRRHIRARRARGWWRRTAASTVPSR